MLTAIALKFIPVRGRKQRDEGRADQGHAVEIYPREGTETSTQLFTYSTQALKFIPVRGRKRVLYFWRINNIR